ncbi:MAG: enoyl-CoA hydratase/isomerase family protein [Flavobacteriales bacterium]|nr:enoyl-CoA hydratase/isomerase family protein [Flavobacteriales bacterium]MCB9449566.1 enoyl-CoA hydratase/isomerase family protein [Flavobacteriales bacterium]
MESVAYQNLLAEVKAGILTITINRPDKMNALNRATLDEIKTAILEASDDPEVKGIIITGAGEKAFVAGADIKEFLDISVAEGKAFAASGQTIFKMIEHCPKPVIAAVNGFALGGGCELAMACHLRVASENARFGQPEVNLGLIPGYGGTQRLIQYVGKSKATELLMTGDMIPAQQALELGLVNYVTPADQLIVKCEEILGKILSKSPVAVKGIIRCVDAYFKDGEDGFATEVEEFGQCFGTEDFKEGTSAFLEKRTPAFPGK